MCPIQFGSQISSQFGSGTEPKSSRPNEKPFGQRFSRGKTLQQFTMFNEIKATSNQENRVGTIFTSSEQITCCQRGIGLRQRGNYFYHKLHAARACIDAPWDFTMLRLDVHHGIKHSNAQGIWVYKFTTTLKVMSNGYKHLLQKKRRWGCSESRHCSGARLLVQARSCLTCGASGSCVQLGACGQKPWRRRRR